MFSRTGGDGARDFFGRSQGSPYARTSQAALFACEIWSLEVPQLSFTARQTCLHSHLMWWFRELGGVPQRSEGLKSAAIDILRFIGGISIEMVSRSLSEAKWSL